MISRFSGDIVVPDPGGLRGDLERYAYDLAKDLGDPDTLALVRATIGTGGEQGAAVCRTERQRQLEAILERDQARGNHPRPWNAPLTPSSPPSTTGPSSPTNPSPPNGHRPSSTSPSCCPAISAVSKPARRSYAVVPFCARCSSVGSWALTSSRPGGFSA
ncbi:TetR-like C-terminal domain-containing protein [Streptomyces sp. NPDC048290]|uniref:TetR-like C-terminal domain-containing protein n=1 Tax=Streptomyces sp. NPDC048290 TaxID=3155811 RepID=UPI00343BD656